MLKTVCRAWSLLLVAMNLGVAAWMVALAAGGRDDAERAVYGSIAVLGVLTAAVIAAGEVTLAMMERHWRK